MVAAELVVGVLLSQISDPVPKHVEHLELVGAVRLGPVALVSGVVEEVAEVGGIVRLEHGTDPHVVHARVLALARTTDDLVVVLLGHDEADADLLFVIGADFLPPLIPVFAEVVDVAPDMLELARINAAYRTIRLG